MFFAFEMDSHKFACILENIVFIEEFASSLEPRTRITYEHGAWITVPFTRDQMLQKFADLGMMGMRRVRTLSDVKGSASDTSSDSASPPTPQKSSE